MSVEGEKKVKTLKRFEGKGFPTDYCAIVSNSPLESVNESAGSDQTALVGQTAESAVPVTSGFEPALPPIYSWQVDLVTKRIAGWTPAVEQPKRLRYTVRRFS